MANNKHKGSLNLDWINKDLSLCYEIDEKEGRGIRPIWVSKSDIRVAEPRILRFEKNYGDPTTENMLVKGDNLLVLRSLIELFKGRKEKDRIKSIYIDPPYNTGNAFKHYDDNLEHSEWLTMMRDRLCLLKQLMRKDGIIFVQISEDELAYLKCLMDEIFGRNQYLSTIAVKTKTGAGVGQESFLFTVHEYVLVYAATDKKLSKNYKIYVERPIEKNVTDTYHFILVNSGKEKHVDTLKSGRGGKIKVFSHSGFDIVNLPSEKRNQDVYYKNFDKIFRTTNPQGGLVTKIIPQLPKNELVSIERVPSKGKNAGQLHRSFFHKGALVVWLKDTAVKDGVTKTASKLVKNNSFWEENLWQGIDPEGGVKFPKSKKPERHIKKIIEMATQEGDFVLDSFAGSGTTGAAAHKMKRRWIMVEIGKHAEDLIIPRMQRVVNGKDNTGITKEVFWKGGNGFKYYILGDSVIHEKDMNWKMKAAEMTEAVFLHFQYKLEKCKAIEDEAMFLGKHRATPYHFAICFASREVMSIAQEQYEKIIDYLDKEKKFRHLTIFTNTSVAMSPEVIDGRVLIEKIPAKILREYNLL